MIPVSALFGEEQGNVSKVWLVGPDNRVSSRVVKVGSVTSGGALLSKACRQGK